MNHIKLDNVKWPVSNNFSINVSKLSLQPNMYKIVGENGAGKSVFLRYLAKLLPVEEAMVQNTCQKILYLTNEDITFPNLTIKENLILNHHIFGINKPIDSSLFAQEQLNTLCREASLGMRQKVGLSLTMIDGFWDLIILDETLSNLDSPSQNLVLETLKTRTTENTIVIIVDHQLKDDNNFQILNIKGGTICEV